MVNLFTFDKELKLKMTDKIIILFCYFLLLVDSLNGFLIQNNIPIPVSLLYKNLFIGFVLIRVLRQQKEMTDIYLILLYVAVLVFSYGFHASGLALGPTLVHLIKFLTTIILYKYFKNLITEHGWPVFPYLSRIFVINGVVLMGSILLGPFGLGYRQYGESFSFRGFFYAGNELSGAFLIIAPFLLYLFLYTRKKITNYYYLLCILLMAVGVLIGTKTGLIAIFLSIIYVHRTYFLQKKQVLLAHKVAAPLIKVLMVVILVAVTANYIQESGSWSRWEYLYSKGGLSELIFSSRDRYWSVEKIEFLEAGVFDKFLGLGGARTVEMDVHDTLLNYGYLGLCVVYGFFALLFWRAFRAKRFTPFFKLVLFVDGMFIMASTLSGHLIFSGTSNTFIALINAFIFFNHITDKTNEKESTVTV